MHTDIVKINADTKPNTKASKPILCRLIKSINFRQILRKRIEIKILYHEKGTMFQPSDAKKRNILYVSKYCLWSNKFQEALQKTPMHSKFVKVFIDIPGVQYPPWLERVPTIQVYDENEKRHILTDKHAFEWLNQKIDTPIDLSAYNDGEMGSSISDCFAFLDKNQESTHSFMYLDAIEKHWITTPDCENHPGGTPAQQRQPNQQRNGQNQQYMGDQEPKNDYSDQALEAFKRQRDQEIPATPQNPTPQMEDQFKRQNGINQNVDNVSGQFLESQLGLVSNKRQQEVKRGPLPKHAPNFQTARFKSDWFQSQRGTGYQPSGIGVNVAPTSSYDVLSEERKANTGYQAPPANLTKPDFRISAATYQKMQPGGTYAQPQPQPLPQPLPQPQPQLYQQGQQGVLQRQPPIQRQQLPPMQQRPQYAPAQPQRQLQRQPLQNPQYLQQLPLPQPHRTQPPPMQQQRHQMQRGSNGGNSGGNSGNGGPVQQSYSQQYASMPHAPIPQMFAGVQAAGGGNTSYAKII